MQRAVPAGSEEPVPCSRGLQRVDPSPMLVVARTTRRLSAGSLSFPSAMLSQFERGHPEKTRGGSCSTEHTKAPRIKTYAHLRGASRNSRNKD